MQRLIDANKYREEWLKFRTFEPMLLLDESPTVLTIPDNPTNGDITKAMFPDLDVIDNGDSVIRLYKSVDYSFEDELVAEYSIDWWNSPFKRGDTDV